MPGKKGTAWLCLLAVILVLLAYLLFGGSVNLTLAQIASGLFGPSANDSTTVIVWEIRLPRLLLSGLVGATLGICGACLQPYFRNPLAEPYVLGVSSGAAMGGTLALLIGLSNYGHVALALLGGILAVLLARSIAGTTSRATSDRLILAGVVVGSLLAALTMLFLSLGGHNTDVMLRWLLGSTNSANWEKVMLVVLAVIPIALVASRWSTQLDSFAFGEAEAFSLGVNVKEVSRVMLATVSLATAASVACVGIIGFVGLVAPHIARRLCGNQLKSHLWASASIGCVLICVADILAMRMVPGRELPLGVMTALIGAPVLLSIIRKQSPAI